MSTQGTPSTTEIVVAMNIARGTAYKYLVEMDDRDMMQRIIDEGTPLQKIRAKQMMGIISEGALKTYVPELALLVSQK